MVILKPSGLKDNVNNMLTPFPGPGAGLRVVCLRLPLFLLNHNSAQKFRQKSPETNEPSSVVFTSSSAWH